MKKLFALLMTVVMAASLAAGFAVTSSAEVTSVEPTYQYNDILSEFGETVPPIFGDGLWMYEYRLVDGDFDVMGHYVVDKADRPGASGDSKCYIPTEESNDYLTNPDCYCEVRTGGKQMHPGTGADPAITFVVPASGVIAYDISAYMDAKDGRTDYFAVYLNDDIVWPANSTEMFEVVSDENKTPVEISIGSLTVKAGDKVRFVVNSGGNRDGKVVILKDLPVVTYLKAEVPIHNFFPPEPVKAVATSDSCTVSWPKAANAVSYNVYLGDEKVNDEPITGTEYTITGLEGGKSYLNLAVTSVNAEGEESEKSTAIGFRTKKGEASATPTTEVSTDAATNTATAAVKTPAEKNNTGLIIGIIAAVVVVVAAVVVVLVVMKKKKGTAATPAEEVKTEEAKVEEPKEEVQEEAKEDAPADDNQ